MPVITIELPFPVSVNRIWRSANRRTYRSPEYVSWLAKAGGEWLAQKPKLKLRRIEGDYRLFVEFYPPDKRHRDLDNLAKCLNDFAQAVGIVENDCMCRDLHLVWGPDEHSSPGAKLIFSSMGLRKA